MDSKIVSLDKKREEVVEEKTIHAMESMQQGELNFKRADDEFRFSVTEQLTFLKELCNQGNALPIKLEGQTIMVPFSEFYEAIADKLKKGKVIVRKADGAAEVVPLKKSIKPKKPKKPSTGAMPVRMECTPEQEAAYQAEKARKRVEKQQRLAAELQYLLERYGEEASRAYQAIVG